MDHVSTAPRLHRHHTRRRVPPLPRRREPELSMQPLGAVDRPVGDRGGHRTGSPLRHLSRMDRRLPGVGRSRPPGGPPIGLGVLRPGSRVLHAPRRSAPPGRQKPVRADDAHAVRRHSRRGAIRRFGITGYSICTRRRKLEPPSSSSADSTATSRSSCRCSPRWSTRDTGSSHSKGRVRAALWKIMACR